MSSQVIYTGNYPLKIVNQEIVRDLITFYFINIPVLRIESHLTLKHMGLIFLLKTHQQ